MMNYPLLEIDLEKIGRNVRALVALCNSYGIAITGVTKVFRGDPVIADIFLKNGITRLGDSRVSNLEKLNTLDCEKWLLRIPSPREAEVVVKYADVSLNSEIATLAALNEACKAQNITHKIVLMIDLGDLREGYIFEKDLLEAADFVRTSSNLELYGAGTNLTCLSYVQPDFQKLSLLCDIARVFDIGTYISGGNSATLALMMEGQVPSGVSFLRLGESLLFGRERANYTYLPGTVNDAFILKAEIVECKRKPSMPWGTIGKDSYGNMPKHIDSGEQLRLICALGRVDCDTETMWPLVPGIKIIGASSDHLVLDATNAENSYNIGDLIEFRLGYFSLMRAYLSDYVEKTYLHLNR